jgi:hypothetical protein
LRRKRVPGRKGRDDGKRRYAQRFCTAFLISPFTAFYRFAPRKFFLAREAALRGDWPSFHEPNQAKGDALKKAPDPPPSKALWRGADSPPWKLWRADGRSRRRCRDDRVHAWNSFRLLPPSSAFFRLLPGGGGEVFSREAHIAGCVFAPLLPCLRGKIGAQRFIGPALTKA